MDLLRGKDIGSCAKGTRSSRVPSSIFNQLRKLDKLISKLDNQAKFLHYSSPTYSAYLKKRAKLDLRRKNIRNKRKYYARNKS